MSYLNNINNSSLDDITKQSTITNFNILVESGLDEKDAYKQALVQALEQNELILEELYNQLTNE